MNARFQQVVDQVAHLPEEKQEQLASLLEDEIMAEQRWLDSFAKSQDVLNQLADEARQARRDGTTQSLDLGLD